MKKLMYMTAMAAVVVLMSALSACSDDDEPEVNPDEKLSALLENKIWQEQPLETRWMTEEGKLVTEDELEPMSGDAHCDSYFFSGDKATVFEYYVAIPIGIRYWRYDYTYSIDWKTGEVSLYTLNGKAAKSFVIESVSENELVVLDSYGYRYDALYRRRVLTPVAKADEQKWWDEYEDHTDR